MSFVLIWLFEIITWVNSRLPFPQSRLPFPQSQCSLLPFPQSQCSLLPFPQSQCSLLPFPQFQCSLKYRRSTISSCKLKVSENQIFSEVSNLCCASIFQAWNESETEASTPRSAINDDDDFLLIGVDEPEKGCWHR